MPGTLQHQRAWQAQLGESVAALAWSPATDVLAAATLDGAVHLLDGPDGTPLARPARHRTDALTLAWSPDGARLASGGADGVVHLHAALGSTTTVETDGWVQALRWSPDGTRLAVAAGRSLLLLDPAGQLVRRWDGQPSTVTDVAWSRDGSRVACAAYGGLRWYTHTTPGPEPVRTLEWKGSLLVVRVSPDGRWIASGNQDASVHIWRLWSGQDAEMTGYPQKVDTLAFAATGRWMACGGAPEISLWDFRGSKGPIGRTPTMLDGHDEQVSALTFQNRGPLLASAGRDGGLALWDPARPDPLTRAVLPARITTLSWSADDQLLAAGTTGGAVEVLRAELPAAAGSRTPGAGRW